MISRNPVGHCFKKPSSRTNFNVVCIILCAAFLALCIPAVKAPGKSDKEGKYSPNYTETVTAKSGEKISFKMVLIPGGKFVMGCSKDDPSPKADEKPSHEVSLDPFYLCPTETTLELFLAYYNETVTARKDNLDVGEKKEEKKQVDAVSGPTPVYGELSMGYGKMNPAMGMTWYNATNFCKWLSKKTGRTYRLPTEAEWEYACRAGTKNVYGYTNDPKQLKDFAWFDDNADGETQEVAQKKPNAFGLYDMLGNVSEWVHDFYQPEAYKEAAQNKPAVNPQGPKTGKVHVARGGDYNASPHELRCAARAFEEDWWRSGDPQIPKSKWWLPNMDIIGLRLAKSIDPKDKMKEGQK